MPLRFKLLIIFMGITIIAAAQSKVGTWGILTVTMPGDSLHRWGGFGEGQVRTNSMYFGQFNYYEIKGGVSFDINKYFITLLGIEHNATYDYNNVAQGPTVSENRLWEQLVVNEYLSRLKIEHRYRVEQRWVNSTYRNRFRYRLSVFVPLNNQRITAKTWFLTGYDEIFLNNKEPNFERNRISASLGYQIDYAWIVQAGWLNQYNYVPNLSNDKDNVVLNLMYRINHKNSVHREHLPTTSN